MNLCRWNFWQVWALTFAILIAVCSTITFTIFGLIVLLKWLGWVHIKWLIIVGLFLAGSALIAKDIYDETRETECN